LAITFDFVGKFLLGITVLLVHRRLGKEHKIDVKVLKALKKEQVLGILGILFIALGYALHFV